MKRLIAFVFGALVLVAGWGFVEPRLVLDETHREASIPGLPEAWDGARIAVMADWQTGMWLANEGMIRRGIARVVAQAPAALLLAGDFLYQPVDEESAQEANEELEPEDLKEIEAQIARTVELLRPVLAAGIPVYAVLGNHDYLKEEFESAAVSGVADQLANALRSAGVTVLRNEAVALPPPKGRSPVAGARSLYLGGIDSLLAGRAEPERMLAAIPQGAPRLVLMHNPDVFAKLPASSAPLALAGHTHGGQMRVPGFPRWSWMALRASGRVTVDGWIHDYGAPGNRLYVNRGIGFSTAPMRINCPPELTWFTLRAQPSGETR
ncbi:metallophosphoesterase [Ramlibacter rhizophilus]|uniref:metallophosphoesterase n=1 Tax=Ramlibacter rhizophilus TaxID=1781167 RepID=UPI0019813281|nr:metallophosphoesterase [Ramlibacter rhizophilus]